MQRAGDRSRGQGEDVDLEPERADQLLLRDAEALLLVDDHEPELLRDHVAREDAVRSDQDVDLAGLEVGQDSLDVGRLAEARDHLDGDREVAVALAEGVPVLLREHGRRHEHQRLLAVQRGRECCADRDLGLAETDVSADEAVHRPRRLEVLLDRLDRRCLVRRSRGTGTTPRAGPASPARGRTRSPARSGGARRAASSSPASSRIAARARLLSWFHALPPSLDSVGDFASAPT